MAKENVFIKAACLIFLLLALPSYSYACRCVKSISLASYYQLAYVVVWGKVLGVKGDINKKEGATARVSVLKAWKMGTSKEINILTSTSCAFDFQSDIEYLLYLYETPGGGYYTTKCVGNLPILDAEKALIWLKQHGTPMEINRP